MAQDTQWDESTQDLNVKRKVHRGGGERKPSFCSCGLKYFCSFNQPSGTVVQFLVDKLICHDLLNM